MKRDPDLIRKILLGTEADSSYLLPAVECFNDLLADGYDQDAISYHVYLLEEAGFLVASNEGSDRLMPVHLTWAGHEFLDAARSDKNWNKVKQALSETGGFVVGVAEKVLIDLVTAQAKQYLT